MRIFFSHSSEDKPLVREIIQGLPTNIQNWIDEESLPVGADINTSLKNTIINKSDLVLLFISNNSIKSNWVKMELDWALKKEMELGYIFIFPIVIHKAAWESIHPISFSKKKHLTLLSTEKIDIESLTKKIEKEIFSWLISRNDSTSKSNQAQPHKRENLETFSIKIFSITIFSIEKKIITNSLAQISIIGLLPLLLLFSYPIYRANKAHSVNSDINYSPATANLSGIWQFKGGNGICYNNCLIDLHQNGQTISGKIINNKYKGELFGFIKDDSKIKGYLLHETPDKTDKVYLNLDIYESHLEGTDKNGIQWQASKL